MHYFEDRALELREGSMDTTVAAPHRPNVPDAYVRELQQDLAAMGYAPGRPDGWFGQGTATALRAFQTDAAGIVRQEIGGPLTTGRRFEESPSPYVVDAAGIVRHVTAQEIRRWIDRRWQRPTRNGTLAIEDVRARLPINPALTPRIRRPSDIDRLVLHCTDAAPTWGVQKCAEYDVRPNHISKTGCPTITYTYFVNADGLVQKCLSHDVVSWHAGTWNRRGLAAVIAYRATGNATPPPSVQLEASAQLFAQLCQALGLDPRASVVGHRELEGTGFIVEKGVRKQRKECPGMRVSLDEFREEIHRRREALRT